ncbi:unnamed protein product [Aureobasidium vineae]|uniref:Uncharacterized protein n=1 Tax=Aureobasidium vineae TaxID=2773715 RepID=A0A9N8JCD5_9PEZI|nr:unnamed protein product [Aureobasidium vineae]
MTNWETGNYINYAKMSENLSIVRQRMNNRPLTYAEKILYSHLDNPTSKILSVVSRTSSSVPTVLLARTPLLRWPFCSSCPLACPPSLPLPLYVRQGYK